MKTMKITKIMIMALLACTVMSTSFFGLNKMTPEEKDDIQSKFGEYTIPTANLSKSCDVYTLDDIIYTDEQVDKKHEELSKMFESGRDSMEAYIKHGDNKDGYQAVKAAAFYAIPSIVFLLLSIICTPLFCLYFFCKSCCCTEKKNKQAGWDSR